MTFLQENPVLFALVIFFARIVDVSLGTLRTILVFRAYRALASSIGFIEVLVWVLAASQVLKNLDAWYLAVAYAGGFAVGNWVGISLEAKLAVGSELVRAVSRSPDVALARALRAADYDVTEITARGDDGSAVEVLLIVTRRRSLKRLLALIDEVDPEAVYTISDVKRHYAGAAQRMLVSSRARGVRK